MYHFAVCINVRGQWTGFVVSAKTEAKAQQFVDTFANRIGYVGGDSFELACKRAGMMERNEDGAWGPSRMIMEA